MYVEVALRLGTFVYKVPRKLESKVWIGSLVKVPLRKSNLDGWVVRICNDEARKSKVDRLAGLLHIKEVIEVCWSEPLLPSPLIELGKWMSSYYQSTLGAVLGLIVPEIGEITSMGESPSCPYKPKVATRLPSVISDSIREMGFKSVLLYGLQRRGIYLQAIEAALSYGRGVILLVPEIDLIPEIFSLLQKRFGGLVALLHSKLRKEERWSEWLKVKRGVSRIVVGAMSAVFSPVRNLGLIIIDDEQSTSYKSERHPFYFAPVVGRMRAKI